MDKVRSDGGANMIEVSGGYTGQGVRAEAMDGNLDASHSELQSNLVIFHGAHSGSASHGTPVTGVVFGDGPVIPGRRGMLPDLSYWYGSIFTIQQGNGSTQFGGMSAATPIRWRGLPRGDRASQRVRRGDLRAGPDGARSGARPGSETREGLANNRSRGPFSITAGPSTGPAVVDDPVARAVDRRLGPV